MVQREVSKIDSHIGQVMGVETSMKPSNVVDLNPEKMILTIPLSWVVAKYSRKTQKLEMPLINKI